MQLGVVNWKTLCSVLFGYCIILAVVVVIYVSADDSLSNMRICSHIALFTISVTVFLWYTCRTCMLDFLDSISILVCCFNWEGA